MRRSAFQATLVSTLLLLLGSSAMAAVLRVKADAPGAGQDGATWGTAFSTIQPALDAGAPGDEVWVAAGTYVGRITLPSGVSLYGGFAGTEDSRGESAPDVHVTTLDADLQDEAVVAHEGDHRTLEGFTLIHAQNAAVSGTSLTVRRCVIRANGNGIYLGPDSVVEDCVSADNLGVGIQADVIRNCVVTRNASGLSSYFTYDHIPGRVLLIENNLVIDNREPDTGAIGCGGVVAVPGAVVRNNVIAWNHGIVAGGVAAGAGATICGNTIVYNTCKETPVVIDGSPVGYAGGIFVSRSDTAFIANNIVAFNSSGIFSWRATATALRSNCVFNNPGGDYPNATNMTGVAGNISADPKLGVLAEHNFHIQPESPCIDAGDDSLFTQGQLDLDGQSRLLGAHVDIGADESDGMAWRRSPYVVRVRTDGNDAKDGGSWQDAKATLGSALAAVRDAGGGEVWAAAGNYAGPITVTSLVALYGGFAGTESTRAERIGAAPSVIAGDPGGPAVLMRGVFHGVVDGFTIRGAGTAVDSTDVDARLHNIQIVGGGTGARAHYGALTIEDCSLSGLSGPAVSTESTMVTLRRNTIADNNGETGQGAVEIRHANALLVEGCSIRENHANGVFLSLCEQGTISGNTIEGNVSDRVGGGIAIWDFPRSDSRPWGSITLRGNRISGNRAAEGGGVVSNRRHVTITANVISHNSAEGAGAGVWSPVDPENPGEPFGVGLYSDLIAWNTGGTESSGVGGGGSVSVYNSTIVGHAVAVSRTRYGSAQIVNSILAGNGKSVDSVVATFRNNCEWNSTNIPGDPSLGNIVADPRFRDAAAGDYHLLSTSPCINHGFDYWVMDLDVDADLGPRFIGPHVDIGAYESPIQNPGSVTDAIRALRVAGGLEPIPADSLAMDVDASGTVDLLDAARLIRDAVGLDKPE